jgi:hypothetical protein
MRDIATPAELNYLLVDGALRGKRWPVNKQHFWPGFLISRHCALAHGIGVAVFQAGIRGDGGGELGLPLVSPGPWLCLFSCSLNLHYAFWRR